ncbi:leucine-rich repeat transmembrane neuronal protein 3-like [Neodiprion fabricii]|uniref:leucine-rich repeat transmembrane neuronal protein 3-like n=1 Tax=Neodiprion fabricii TaxID=2872261 RepID=UPI001ED9266E|nr:leucine-rich repeat transmembrane neuronal protein 3-like [Neodiprion fabricii]
MMSRFCATFLAIVAFACYVELVSGEKWAKYWIDKNKAYPYFGSYGVSKFSYLDKAPSKLRSITYYKCNLPNIEGNVFYRFRNTLENLDIHESNVETISSDAFYKLTHLRNLTLWGNKLQRVFQAWFKDLSELRTLDLSFNQISLIDEEAFTKMPKLENLYIEHNLLVVLNPAVFTYLGNLKTIRLGRNPWDWWFRTLIMRQLDDQRVSYSNDWEDFKWISHVIWTCIEKDQAKNDDDTILDCASAYLLSETSNISNTDQKYCSQEARNLYNCEKNHDEKRNVSMTPKVVVRKVFQAFIGAVNKMLYPDAELTYRGGIAAPETRGEEIAIFGD